MGESPEEVASNLANVIKNKGYGQRISIYLQQIGKKTWDGTITYDRM